MNEPYYVVYNCHNCNRWFEMVIDFGIEASAKETCPNCGVWGATKSTRLTQYAGGLVVGASKSDKKPKPATTSR